MEKKEAGAVIKYLKIKGLAPVEIKTELNSTLDSSSPALTTVCKWFHEFQRGSTSTKDAPRQGRPKTATSEDMIEKVRQIVLSDRRLKLAEIAEASKISKERVHKILHEDLDMRKLSAKWVPRLLTLEQKQNRGTTSEQCLELMQQRNDFWRCFITMDETWLRYYTLETKRQSMQ